MELTDLRKRMSSLDATFLLGCAFLAVIKIILVSGEEIIARDQPYDDLWQILAAARGYWLRDGYTNMSLVHLPIYSVWAAVVHFTGIPLRIAHELMFVVSGFVFVMALSKLNVGRVIRTCIYGLIIFHPVSFHLFNYSLAEVLYAPLFLMALAAMISMWINRTEISCYVYSLATGIICALLWNLRKENVLVLGLLCLLALVAVLVSRLEGHSRTSILRIFGITFVMPIMIIVLFSSAIKTINFLKFRLFVSTEMSAPGYTAAYKAIVRIRPPHSIRFVPVTKEVRMAAYAVSPAFKELEPYFEGEFGHAAAAETRKWMGIEGEIAAGWFYWALRDAATLAGHHTSARAAEAYYQRVADEINLAIVSGRLESRLVPTTFLDPEFNNYLPYLPNSFLKMWRLFVSSHEPLREREAADINPTVSRAFDIVANRRTALTNYGIVTIEGWAFQGSQPMKKVLLKSSGGEVLGSCQTMSPRPDVAQAYFPPGNVDSPVNSGFTVIAAKAGQQLDDAQLVFIDYAKKEFSVPYKAVVIGKPAQSLWSDGKQTITYAIDSSSAPKILALRGSIKSLVWAGYGRLVEILSYLGVSSLFVLFVFRRFIRLKDNIYMILLLLFFAVLSRVSLFALLDASSWPGNQARYLFPVMTVYSSFLLLLIAQAFSVVKMRYDDRFND